MELKRIALGITNAYLVLGKDGYLLVDAGEPHKGRRFKKELSRLGIEPSKVKLIVITHAHYDHVGSLKFIKDLCGCPVAMHPLEADILGRGLVAIPPGVNGVGRFFSGLGRVVRPLLKFPAVKADILIEDDYDLRPWGIDGCVIATPGHTAGSLSVLLADGRALVGDLAMNFWNRGDKFPVFAEQPEMVKPNWARLKSAGASWIYPAHGVRFSISELQ